MSTNLKYLISSLVLITLIIIKEIPYANVIISDKFWTIGILSYVIFAALFVPSNFLWKYFKLKYLFYLFILSIISLLIATLLEASILQELFGNLIYGIFWAAIVYKFYSTIVPAGKNGEK